METEHTPGPWAVYPGNYHAAFVVPQRHVGRKLGGADDDLEDLTQYAQEICTVDDYHRHRTATEQRANARLIAAAPELLAELQRVYERSYNPFEPDNQSEEYKRVGALIAKATAAKP